MNNWFEYYRNRMCPEYLEHIKVKYFFLIDAIISNSRKNDSITEIGCGAGNITKLLYQKRKNLTAVDICDKMLELTKINNKNNKINILKKDIVNTKTKGNIIHSHGVLEHFSDEQIVKIIKNHSSAKVQFHYVPSYKYQKPSFGDERLLNKQEWHQILADFRHEVIAFNDEFDYLLVIYGKK